MSKNQLKNQINDTAITAGIKGKFLTDDRVPTFGIEVNTKNGIVYLSGEVNSEDALYSAIEIAYSTKDVEGVDTSELRVVPSSKSPIEDSIITAKVKGLFLKEEFLGDLPLKLFMVNIKTVDNVVHLKGKLNSKTEGEVAEKLAKSVRGVKDVVNEIEYEEQS